MVQEVVPVPTSHRLAQSGAYLETDPLFFAPILERGPRSIDLRAGFEARELLRDKRALAALRLPGKFLFLFRLRFGLYAVLARMGAVADWSALESGWAQDAFSAVETAEGTAPDPS